MKNLCLSLAAMTVLFAACAEANQPNTEAATSSVVTTTSDTITKAATAAMYECPMKCEPASDKRGKCSKCKMDLVLVK